MFSTNSVTRGTFKPGLRTTVSIPLPSHTAAVPYPPVFRLKIPLRPNPKPAVKQKVYARPMADTVCIAAVCNHLPRKSSVILCSDARIEYEGIGSGEVKYKSRLLTSQFSVMLSGDLSKPRELADRYRFHLEKAQLTEKTVLEELQKSLDAQTRLDISEYLGCKQGIGYKRYERSSPGDRGLMLSGFMVKSVDLIIIWLAPATPRLFICKLGEGVVELPSFAVVGCGWYAAHTSLCVRNYDEAKSFEECILVHIFCH